MPNTTASADETGAIVATFTIEVKARGKVSAKGRFANGKTTSANSQLMVADDGGEASVAIKGSKKIPFAAVVWFGKDGTVTVESITTSVAKGVKCVAAGKAGGLAAGGYTLQSGNLTAPLAFNGSKFQRSSAANVTSYKTATGVFSGNYKDASGEAKKGKVDFGGVVIDGIGYGTTKSGASVTITPAAK